MSFPTEAEYKTFKQLLDDHVIKPGTATAGIIQRVLERGYDSLTKRQRYVFYRYVVETHCIGTAIGLDQGRLGQ